MPELLEISGLDGDDLRTPAKHLVAGFVSSLIAAALVYAFFRKPGSSLLGDLGIIKKCRPKDLKSGRPKDDQRWCLWDSKGKRILGRHPSQSRALRQERLIQLKKRGLL